MAVFRDARDHEMFLDTLEEACVRCGWRVHAFVLMGNHYHLLVETPKPNLVFGMQWLQGTYTKRFNVRHQERGHLFQGRYKALLVDDGEYFSTVANYIHLNPARIQGVDFSQYRLEEHVWSSYPGYVWLRKRPEWLCAGRVLESAGLSDSPQGRKAYRGLMDMRVLEMSQSHEPWLIDEGWRKIRHGWCFGEETFRQQMKNRLSGVLGGKKKESFTGEEIRTHNQEEAERLIQLGMKALGIGEPDWDEMKKACPEKVAVAWLIRRHTSVRPQWIKERLRMGKSTQFATMLKRMSDGDFGGEYFEKVKNIKL